MLPSIAKVPFSFLFGEKKGVVAICCRKNFYTLDFFDPLRKAVHNAVEELCELLEYSGEGIASRRLLSVCAVSNNFGNFLDCLQSEGDSVRRVLANESVIQVLEIVEVFQRVLVLVRELDGSIVKKESLGAILRLTIHLQEVCVEAVREDEGKFVVEMHFLGS